MDADLAVVGAGLVGLAVADAARRRFPRRRVMVLEAESRPVAHQSSHNSGVLHSGVYYAPGSLKARLCVEGHRRMREFCAAHGVALRERGKLLVAADAAGETRLAALRERAAANGLEGARWLGAGQIAATEPAVRGRAALLLPQTASVDFAGVGRALAARLDDAGVGVRLGAPVRGARPTRGGLELDLGGDRVRVASAIVCAGAWADRVARRFGVDPGLSIVPFRGRYLRVVAGPAAGVRHLVYPVPDPALPFLGIHLTRTVDDTVLAGPNALVSASRDAEVAWRGRDVRDLLRPALVRLAWRHRAEVGEELRRVTSRTAWAAELFALVPGVRASHLRPAWSGVRAQAMDPDGTLVDDFRFASGEGSLHVLNAPSPAATAALAIAGYVVDRAAGELGLPG